MEQRRMDNQTKARMRCSWWLYHGILRLQRTVIGRKRTTWYCAMFLIVLCIWMYLDNIGNFQRQLSLDNSEEHPDGFLPDDGNGHHSRPPPLPRTRDSSSSSRYPPNNGNRLPRRRGGEKDLPQPPASPGASGRRPRAKHDVGNTSADTGPEDQLSAQLSGGGVREKTSRSWESVQADRQRQVQRYCQGNWRLADDNPTHNLVLLPDRRLLYCPVEKAASTFMRRFLYTLDQAEIFEVLQSPFKVPIQLALKSSHHTSSRSPLGKRLNLFEFDSRLIVVREPYSRIFSAFVDKLIAPNDYYWKSWGIPIAYRRPSPRMGSIKCGHDVTFPEFVKYVITYLHRVDPHVQPIGRLCAPCLVNYTFIGRLETLRSDFDYLLTSVLGVTIANFSIRELDTQVPYDAIQDSVSSAFQFYSSFQRCLTKHEMCRRLWLKLQIRGIVDVRRRLPLTPDEAEEISEDEFFRLLLQAWKDSTDAKALRTQKQRALKKAFSLVPTNDIERLTEIYNADFQMFGYEKYPPFIGMKDPALKRGFS